jgi:hypothetical protein
VQPVTAAKVDFVHRTTPCFKQTLADHWFKLDRWQGDCHDCDVQDHTNGVDSMSASAQFRRTLSFGTSTIPG